jgi:hypothetical protein
VAGYHGAVVAAWLKFNALAYNETMSLEFQDVAKEIFRVLINYLATEKIAIFQQTQYQDVNVRTEGAPGGNQWNAWSAPWCRVFFTYRSSAVLTGLFTVTEHHVPRDLCSAQSCGMSFSPINRHAVMM